MEEASITVAQRLERVRQDVSDAARVAGRNPADITTIVVTKFHSSALVGELANHGVRDCGESRHQEARDKAHALVHLGVTWHFVGQLQTKKARHVRAYSRVIHSVDRPRLVRALADDGDVADAREVRCFVQINLAVGAGRGGVDPSHMEPLAESVVSSRNLRLLGVMAIAPIGMAPRAAFEELRSYSERIQRIAPDATAISAGMSNDYRDAVLEGATHLRIGTAITGSRPGAA